MMDGTVTALVIILIATLFYMILVFAIASSNQNNNTKPELNQKKKTKSEPTSADVIDTLDWMLANSIITPQEYSKLMGKCLPFIQ